MRKQHNLVICPVCHSPMGLEKGRYGLYYRCLRYPKCKANHSAFSNGDPMGFPADRKTRQKRIKLHKLLKRVWNDKDLKERKKMYDWLKQNSENGHVSLMNWEEVNQVIKKIEVLIVAIYGE